MSDPESNDEEMALKRERQIEEWKKSPSILLMKFFEPGGPWVLVPDGSILGAFDFVPKHLRVGPWNVLVPFYLIAAVWAIVQFKPDAVLDSMEVVYPELYSKWWYYNAVAGVWMFGFLAILLWEKWIVIGTYTIQSWGYLTIRHCITALSPFLKDESSFLLKFNECLRFPALVTATITFVFWNFLIGPAIFYFMKTPKRRRAFMKFNTSFRLIQLHVFNIVFAVLNNVSVSPRRLFKFEDLWCSLSLGMLYNLFYVLVLDRIGLHLYPIFSPRSKFAVVFMMLSWGVYYLAYTLWNRAIETGFFTINEK